MGNPYHSHSERNSKSQKHSGDSYHRRRYSKSPPQTKNQKNKSSKDKLEGLITDTKQIVTERQRIETEKKELLSAMSSCHASKPKSPPSKHSSTLRNDISTHRNSPRDYTRREPYENRPKSDRMRHQTTESSR